MTSNSVAHATFTVERVYTAPITRVFEAWADSATKARWFAGGEAKHELDFRVGGREVTRGHHDGVDMVFESWYRDIVPEERIVYVSSLTSAGKLATVSTTTVLLAPKGEATRLLLTEQGTFLDRLEEPGWREQGTSDQLSALEAELDAVRTNVE